MIHYVCGSCMLYISDWSNKFNESKLTAGKRRAKIMKEGGKNK